MATDVSANLGTIINDIARFLRRRFDARVKDIGVTRPQWRVLLNLSRYPGITQTAMADVLDVERITAGRMIDRLVDAQLVERRPDPSDRRVWRLHLLPKAHDLIEHLQGVASELDQELFDILGTDKTVIVERLAQLREALRPRECAGPQKVVA